jgi:galactonate dehydratase
MKITAIRGHRVPSALGWPWILVTVETDAGLTGVGDATNWPGGRAVEGAIAELDGLLRGEDPRRIGPLWTKMQHHLTYVGSAGAAVGAIGGVDIALWDIAGKLSGMPVYQLLGGAYRTRIPLYANNWFAGTPREPEAFAEAARRTVSQGYRALKFDPLTGIDPDSREASRTALEAAARMVEAVRAAVGPDIEIAVDTHARLDVPSVIRFAEMLEPSRIWFLEEPVGPENPEAMADVRRRVKALICTGERLFTRHGFRRVLESHAADILMPDVVRTGGLSETKAIAALAEMYYIPIAPHNPNSPLSTLASAHLCAAIPNFARLEFLAVDAPWRDDILTAPLPVEDGHLVLSDRAGLGVDVRWDRVERLQVGAPP